MIGTAASSRQGCQDGRPEPTATITRGVAARRVESEIHDHYDDRTITIAAIASKAL
jgi:hypothetical protein